MSYLQGIRKEIGSRRIFVPGVRAIIVNDAGDILLQHRRDNALWGLPGGSVEIDETAIEALKREVREETALKVIEAEPMALYCGPRQKFSYPNGDQVQCFAVSFIVRKWEGRPHADGLEGSMVRFFSISELPESLVPVHQQTLEDYVRYDGTFLLSG
ncbi:MAG: NUDIX domain-containing protein [Desulfosarcina sp.]|nr:NUDIX domain-containing protein [Desulfosarcina sp.]MBC2743937.1 NUDIX domain-containing protein [Desulfosarcina sp.]MBC2766846.1 NUDIX domain-containing protein [Desulfosarcina sp.]